MKRRGLPMVEYPQSSGNLTAAGQNLYDLIRNRNLTMYPDAELRRPALNAVAVEIGRGWRLAKEKTSQKVDGLAALSFAALDAIDRRLSLDEPPTVGGERHAFSDPGDPVHEPPTVGGERHAFSDPGDPVHEPLHYSLTF